jgi:hypothetical protein
MGSIETDFDAQSPDVSQCRMFLAQDFFERVFQATASNIHVPVQQWRGKKLHLLANKTRALLVSVCGKL